MLSLPCQIKNPLLRIMVISPSVWQVLEESKCIAESYRCSYVIPEHVLTVLYGQEAFRQSLEESGYGLEGFCQAVGSFVDAFASKSDCKIGPIKISRPLRWALEDAIEFASDRPDSVLRIPHIIYGISLLKDTLGGYLLREKGASLSKLLSHLDDLYS